MDTPFTARNVAKHIAQAAVGLQASRLVKHVATTYTTIDEESKALDIGCGVAGWYVSDKLEPVTDRLVDTVGDFVAAKREKRAAKKAAKQETK